MNIKDLKNKIWHLPDDTQLIIIPSDDDREESQLQMDWDMWSRTRVKDKGQVLILSFPFGKTEIESELEAVKAELDETELDNDWQKARVELLEKHYKTLILKHSESQAENERLKKGIDNLEAERDELKAKLAESDLVSRKELLEWLEKHSDFTPTTSYGEGYKIALTDIISHLTQPKEGETFNSLPDHPEKESSNER